MNELRIKLVTKDGCLIQNRVGNRDMWFIRSWNGNAKPTLDKKYAEYNLARDCREKGVKLVSWQLVSMYQIEGIVEWI